MDSEIQQSILDAIKSAFPELDLPEISLEHPANPAHGEWSANVALVLAKQVGSNPRDVAAKIVEKLNTPKFLEKVEIAGPGFINFHPSPEYYLEALLGAIRSDFGRLSIGEGKQVMVEFGQPNTHKAFHVGHLKSAISGLAMANMLDNAGYKIIKANYYGDVGMHVAKATWGVKQKGIPEGFAEWDSHRRMKYIDECYGFGSREFKDNPASEKEIRAINKEIYQEVGNDDVVLYRKLRDWSLEHLNEVFATLGIVYDRQYPESEIYKDAIKIVNDYKGKIFSESEGAIIFDGKESGLTSWVFLTSEGNPTYSAKDLALAAKKFAEYPDLYLGIVTTSVEQKDYFRAVIHCLELIQPEIKGRYRHIPFGWMLRDNRKTSSRMGDSIKGVDIINEAREVAKSKISGLKKYSDEQVAQISDQVALAGLKFLVLSHEFHKDFNYDPETFLSFEGFSGPYVLYAYARARSILRQVAELPTSLGEVELSEIELALLRKLIRLPEIMAKAANDIAPHLVCNFVFEVAQSFNQFYSEKPVLTETDEGLKSARILLTQSVSVVLKNALASIGIQVIEQM